MVSVMYIVTKHYMTSYDVICIAGSRLVGQIPILKGNEAERKRKPYIRDTLNVFHAAMQRICEPLEEAAFMYCFIHYVMLYNVM